MKFQIEQIFTLKDKACLLCKSLDTPVIFKLSDSCRLGVFEIENWFDIPTVLDENGNQRKDVYAFLLKDAKDREHISKDDIFELLNYSVTVIESFYTISGIIYSVLACGTGMLNLGTIIESFDGKRWQVVKNGFIIGKPKDEQLQKKVVENFWFQYKLQAINHNELPKPGVQLHIVNDEIRG